MSQGDDRRPFEPRLVGFERRDHRAKGFAFDRLELTLKGFDLRPIKELLPGGAILALPIEQPFEITSAGDESFARGCASSAETVRKSAFAARALSVSSSSGDCAMALGDRPHKRQNSTGPRMYAEASIDQDIAASLHFQGRRGRPCRRRAATEAQAWIDLARKLGTARPELRDPVHRIHRARDEPPHALRDRVGRERPAEIRPDRQPGDARPLDTPYIFTVALQDGAWDHNTSYASERAARPDTVRLLTVTTVEKRGVDPPVPLEQLQQCGDVFFFFALLTGTASMRPPCGEAEGLASSRPLPRRRARPACTSRRSRRSRCRARR